MIKDLLLVAAGSLTGGILRYLTSEKINGGEPTDFPIGTLAVNIIGCFLIGVIAAAGIKWSWDRTVVLYLSVGLLGGFTTFSAFSYEVITLFQYGLLLKAAAYIALSVSVGIAATYFGYTLVQ